MKKIVFILVIVIVGLAVWVYLLLGKGGEKSTTAKQEQKTTIVEDKPAKKPVETSVRATTSPTAPANTDAGMEFPTI